MPFPDQRIAAACAVGSATLWLLAALVVPGSAYGADEATCREYAAKTMGQVRLARQHRCPDLSGPSWLDNEALHHGWCLTADTSLLRSELEKRAAVLRSCGAQAQTQPAQMQTGIREIAPAPMQTGIREIAPAPRPEGSTTTSVPPVRIPPTAAAVPGGAQALDQLGTVSRMYTLPVAAAIWSDGGGQDREIVECIILNTSSGVRTVEVAMKHQGRTLQSQTYRLAPEEQAGFMRDTTLRVTCEFRVEGPSSQYRAGAVVWGAGFRTGNPTSHPAY